MTENDQISISNPHSKRDKLRLNSWKKRFEILDKIDGEYWTRSGELEAKERAKLAFRVWAFVFGGFYYFAKGMWAKGICILIITLIIISATMPVLGVMGVNETWEAYFYYFISPCTAGVACACMATTDYYKRVEFNEKMWPIFSYFMPSYVLKIPTLLALLVAAFFGNLWVEHRTGFGAWNCDDVDVEQMLTALYDENFATVGESARWMQETEVTSRSSGRRSCVGELVVYSDLVDSYHTYDVEYSVTSIGFLGLEDTWVNLDGAKFSDD